MTLQIDNFQPNKALQMQQWTMIMYVRGNLLHSCVYKEIHNAIHIYTGSRRSAGKGVRSPGPGSFFRDRVGRRGESVGPQSMERTFRRATRDERIVLCLYSKNIKNRNWFFFRPKFTESINAPEKRKSYCSCVTLPALCYGVGADSLKNISVPCYISTNWHCFAFFNFK